MERWSVERSQEWAAKQPWFFGANFTPSTAINQLEMWQAETFDPETIDRELGYAQDIGMNIMRVYLHDLLWEHDRDGFINRIDQYLAISDARGIKTMLTIFDDCWHGDFALGPQPEPKPCTHNPGWLQSPGHDIVEDPWDWPRLERYVQELLERFKDDPRVAVWDLYNEPGNGKEGDADQTNLRGVKSLPMLETVFQWAREVDGVTQPLTVSYWCDIEELNACVFERSDIITFHSYDPPDEGFIRKMERSQSFGRPVICSEYMGRSHGCTFENCLPILKKAGVGAINWGLVSGKTQTIYPWNWDESKGEPPVLFHDVFNPDGSFLCPEEEEQIRQVVES